MNKARGDEPPVDDERVGDDPVTDPAVAELESGPPFNEEPPRPIQPIRRRSSTASGSILAAAMLGLRDVLEGPQKEKIVIQAEVPGEPPDIDKVGLQTELEDGRLAVGPPLDELKDQAAASRRSGRARRRRRS
jgi:hypothetical protein